MVSPTTTPWMRIVLKQGDDHPIVIPVFEGTSPVNLTGWTAKAEAWTSETDLAHTWTTEDGSAMCNSSGVILLTDDSTSWVWNYAQFDVVAVSPEGYQVVPAEGIIEVRRLLTR